MAILSKQAHQWDDPQRDKWDIFYESIPLSTLHYNALNSKFSSSLWSLFVNELSLGNDTFDFGMQQPSPDMPNINVQTDELQLPEVNTTPKAHTPLKPHAPVDAWDSVSIISPQAPSKPVAPVNAQWSFK